MLGAGGVRVVGVVGGGSGKERLGSVAGGCKGPVASLPLRESRPFSGSLGSRGSQRPRVSPGPAGSLTHVGPAPVSPSVPRVPQVDRMHEGGVLPRIRPAFGIEWFSIQHTGIIRHIAR